MSVAGPALTDGGLGASLLADADEEDAHSCEAARRARISAPQLQQQISRLNDRIKLRHLKDNLAESKDSRSVRPACVSHK